MALLSWLHLCHGNGHYYLTLAVLIYGYLMLHASASSTTTNMSVESNLTTITTKITTTEISLAISEKKPKRDVAHVPDDDYDASYPDDLDDLDALINNKSGEYSIYRYKDMWIWTD